MKDGQIVQVGRPEEILENPANEYVSNFVKDVDRSKVLKASHVMKRPDVLVKHKDGPHMAVRKMEEAGASSIFVVDKDNNFKGLLTIDAAIKAFKDNIPLEKVLIKEVHMTPQNTPLSDLIGVAVEAKYPITVIEDGKLLGIISRVSILSGLVLGKEKNKKVEKEIDIEIETDEEGGVCMNYFNFPLEKWTNHF